MRLTGIKGVVANLNKEIAKMKVKSNRGLILAAAVIMRDTEKTPPLTPVNLGNLRGSRFITTGRLAPTMGSSSDFKGDDKSKLTGNHAAVVDMAGARARVAGAVQPTVVMGFSAYYAEFVHENLRTSMLPSNKGSGKKKERRPGSGAKFFESSINRNMSKITTLIAKGMKP